MKVILTLDDLDIDSNTLELDIADFHHRETARAVVVDEEQAIALIYAATKSYYELPGGGIRVAESVKHALHREMFEEIGCKVGIIKELGITEEYRHFNQSRQTSYWYLVKLVGDKGIPVYTTDEMQAGFGVCWVKNLDEAIEKIEYGIDEIKEHGLKLMRKRDLYILNIVKNSMF